MTVANIPWKIHGIIKVRESITDLIFKKRM